jgi:hemerythrin superfamily protein
MAKTTRSTSNGWGITAGLAAGAVAAGAFALMRRRGLVGKPTLHAAEMLRSDHEKTKRLFRRFAETTDPALKDQLAGDILTELEIHEVIEEEIFYPAARQATGRDDIMDLAEAQHQKANELIAEIQKRRSDGRDYHKVMEELAAAVREHIADEESEMLPRAEEAPVSMRMLGAKMLARKQQLKMRLGYNTAALKQDMSGTAPTSVAEPVV